MTKLDNSLLGIFNSHIRRLLLLNFFINPDKEYYTRELEKKFSTNAGNLSRELRRIETTGLIKSRPIGNLLLYSANRNSNLFEEFSQLVLKTVGVDYLLEPFIITDKKILSAFIYGSYAKQQFDSISDIDLFVLIDKSDDVFYEEFIQRLDNAERIIGREINAEIILKSELANKLKSNDPYYQDILTGPKIFIKGEENDLGFKSAHKT